MPFASDPGALHGRDQALAVVEAVLADARSRRRGLALITGPAGHGKTSLLRRALDDSGAIVLWASGAEEERHLAHGLIDQLIRTSPLDDQARRDLRESMGPDPVTTGIAMVGLVDHLDLDPQRPLVVVVDDAHWADDASLAALAFAARRLRRDPVALLLAARTESLDQLPEGLRRLVADEGRAFELEPLGRTEVRAMVAERYGKDLGASASERLRAHTAGVPIHLAALLDELDAEALTSSDDLPTPRSFSTLILSRLAGADPAVEALVTAAAVIGEARPIEVLAEIADVADPLTALDEAIERGLLVEERTPEGGTRVAVSHGLIASSVAADLAPGRRSELHRRVAARSTGVERLRHRLLGAQGDDAGLWTEAMAAVEGSRAAGEVALAGHLALLAAPVAPDAASQQLSLLIATDLQIQAGHLDAAAGRRDQIASFEPSPWRSYVLGRIAYVLGPRPEAAAHLEQAWEALARSPESDPRLASAVAALLATVAVDHADGEAGIRWALQALALDPLEASRAGTAHLLAGAYALGGDLEVGWAELDRLCQASHEADPVIVADVFSGRGLLSLWRHQLDASAADFERSLEAAATAAPFVVRETTRYYLAEALYRLGRWDDAILLAEKAASLVDDSDQLWMAAIPHATCARPLAARGLDTGRAHLERSLSAADVVRGVSRVLASASAIEVAAAEHDADEVAKVGEWLTPRAPDERLVPWRATYVEALVALERLTDADSVTAGLADAPRTPLVEADLIRARAAIAGARGDDDALAATETETAALDPDLVGPFPFARLELSLGHARRRRGQRRQAMTWLASARTRFEALGADAWLARVDREIEACGLRPTRRRGREGADLTPTERMVAELVMRGLTNREVATELVISAKTVEHHLSHIYAKVGVRSRTELGHALRSGHPAP